MRVMAKVAREIANTVNSRISVNISKALSRDWEATSVICWNDLHASWIVSGSREFSCLLTAMKKSSAFQPSMDCPMVKDDQIDVQRMGE